MNWSQRKRRADVIDLGRYNSPAGRTSCHPYKPNPRLYPGPQARPRRRDAPAANPTGRPLPAARPTGRPSPAARLTRPPPRSTRSPPRSTRSPPRPTRSPPRSTRSPPRSTRSPPRSTRSPLRSTRLPPRSNRSPPRSIRPPPRRRCARRPVLPSARLYKPPSPRPRPPPLVPRVTWSPPAPPRALDTASHAALRLAARLDASPAKTQRRPRSSPPVPTPPPPVPRSRHLVVTLPAAGDAGAPCSRPAPAPASPPRLRSSTPRSALARSVMAAPPRHSASPEDRSDGNDPLSAPSEYLAEFLSAIMQQQYAEALKYCRLILQYEPHNATARGFYPLLRHKLGQARGRSVRAPPRGSDSDDASRYSAAPPRDEEVMSHSADESGSEGSCASQSSLSLDSSERSGSGGRTGASASHTHTHSSSSSTRWVTDGASDEPDDNGNAPPVPVPTPAVTIAPRPDDVENDNAGGGGDHTARLKSESAASLRRLRALFACEIK